MEPNEGTKRGRDGSYSETYILICISTKDGGLVYYQVVGNGLPEAPGWCETWYG